MHSEYKGSIATLSMVATQINERYGAEAVKIYNPNVNCFTYLGWKERGYQVKKGEKAIHSVTFIPIKEKDTATGKEETKYSRPRNVNLFFITQVEKLTQ